MAAGRCAPHYAVEVDGVLRETSIEFRHFTGPLKGG
jgi:hypothetical protein